VRILLLTPGLGLGGSERLTLAYARGLNARGHSTLIAHGPPLRLADAADEAGVERLLVSEHRLAVRSLPEWLRALHALIREFKPDLVHTQSVRTTVAIALAAPRMPLLATVHGIEESEELGAALALRFSRARVAAVSQASADGLERHRFAPEVVIVPGGVDIADLERASRAPSATPIPSRRPLVACLARHFPVKGVDVLVEAFPRVLEAVPEAGLLLVGGGPDHDALIARSEALGIREAVTFTDRQTSPAPYLAAADLAVLPSRREGLPVSALEAFALGKAVVATAVGGTPDVVRDGETGWLVPPEDPAALAAAVISALAQPEERERRARAGHALVAREYSMEAMIDRIENLCRSLIARRARRPGAVYRAHRAYQQARIARARLLPPSWSGVRILGYHRIADAGDALSVAPADFRAQMRAVSESGATPIRLDAALELLRGPAVRDRYICVTFDDGYRDNLLEAAPVLREHGIPATIYLPSRIIDGELPFHWYDDPPQPLSWAEVGELLADGLIDVQSHTLTHPLLPQVDAARSRAEIVESKREIEQHVPYALTSFCYPAGLYGPREVAFVREGGYAAAVTTNPGVNAGAGDLLQLRRTLIYGADDLATFRAKLGGALDSETVLRRALHARRSRAA
jgi:glycosyltransferase involved in cell wall biosynthesis/peptidoglycan/xylan/chitin deacetylase (PgdA/CDA1 family)